MAFGSGRTIVDHVSTESDTRPVLRILGGEAIDLQGFSNATCTDTPTVRTLSGGGSASLGKAKGYHLQYSFEVTNSDSFVTLTLTDKNNNVVYATSHEKLGSGAETIR